MQVVSELEPTDRVRLAGAPDLSDQARVRLRGPQVGVLHLLTPGGYAQLDLQTDAVELVTDRAEVAADLLQAAAERAGHDLLVWSKAEPATGPADSPIAAALRAAGAPRERVLWQLRRTGGGPPPRPFPDGVTVRTFEVGRDEAAWLAVNAAAFAHHPEQGRMTLADLQAREEESWFDPRGFLLAEREGELLGFHWTKVHPGPPAVGEVYVLGVSPAAQGTGLGGALLDAGLHHLAGRGLAQTLLYVDADNPGAVALYERAGFVKFSADVQYRWVC